MPEFPSVPDHDPSSAAIRAINHVALSLLSLSRLEDFLQETLERVMEVMGTEGGAVHLLDEDGRELRLVAHTGLSEAIIADADRIRLGEGLPGLVAQSGEPLLVDDLMTDSRVTRRVARAEGFRGFAAVPLKTLLKTYGTMQVITHQRRTFPPEHISLLRAIGAHVGLGIENARLVLKLRGRVQAESLLHRVSATLNAAPDWGHALRTVTDHVGRTLDTRRCVMAISHAGSRPSVEYEYCPLDRPMGAAWVRRLGRDLSRPLEARRSAWLIDDIAAVPATARTRNRFLHHDVTSCVLAPVFCDGHLTGLLMAEGRAGRPWRAEEVALIEAVANQTALALDCARLERDLVASARQFRDLVENARDLIFQIDRDGRIVYVNPVLKQMLQFEPAELYAADPWSLRLVHPDDRERVRQRFVEALDSGRDDVFDYRLRHRDGRTVRWVSQSLSLLRGPGRRVRGVLALARDVTDERKLQQQMAEASRLADLGRLAAQIAHEIRNPLGAIVSCIEVLQQDGGAAADPRLLKVTTEEAAHLNTILSELLVFAKPAERDEEPFDVSDVVEDALRLFQQHAKSRPHVRITFERCPVLPLVQGDRHQIRQALWNLLANALDAVGQQGEILVTLHARAADGVPALTLSVSDTGSGIKESISHQVLEPFFTTKAGGTGLGLAIVNRVVREHGGTLQFTSRPGGGTVFSLSLPALAPVPAPVTSESRHAR